MHGGLREGKGLLFRGSSLTFFVSKQGHMYVINILNSEKVNIFKQHIYFLCVHCCFFIIVMQRHYVGHKLS